MLLGLSFGKLFDRPDTLVSGLWCVVASIVVIQDNLGGTYKAAWERFLGVFIGSIIGCVCSKWLGASALNLALSISGTAIICYFLNLKDSIRIASLSVAIIMVFWGEKGEIDPWVFGIYRFIDSCLGIFVGVVVAHVLWPSQAADKLQINVSKILHALNKLFLNSVDMDSSKDLHSKAVFLQESEVLDLFKESYAYLDEVNLEVIIHRTPIEEWKFLLRSLESVYESIITLKELSKGKLSLMLDEPLLKKFESYVEDAEISLEEFSKELETGNSTRTKMISSDLVASIKELKEELLRFRKTKATRKFDLEDVEAFYVFFYCLGTISDELLRIREIIPKITGTRGI